MKSVRQATNQLSILW